MHLCATGHERAFEAIVQRYRKPLHRYCRRLLLPEARAEDAVQQAFINAWSALESGTHVDNLSAWLHRVAHNAAISELRRSGYDYAELHDSLRGADAPEADLERRTEVREVLAGIALLPDRQRQALLRTALEGRSQAEVARELQVSTGAISLLVHRARKTLRSAATALVPLPLIRRLMGGGRHDTLGERAGEIAAGGGLAGVAATVGKATVVLVGVGAIAAGPAAIAVRQADPAPPRPGGTSPAAALHEAEHPAALPVPDTPATTEEESPLSSAPADESAEASAPGEPPAEETPAETPDLPPEQGEGDGGDSDDGSGNGWNGVIIPGEDVPLDYEIESGVPVGLETGP